MATIPSKEGTNLIRAASAAREAVRRGGRHPVRVFNHYVLNPILQRFAGRPGFYAALLRHTGRRSGRAYETPVVAMLVNDGVLIPLPYGAHTDWCRNVLAAGRCSMVFHGDTYQL